MVIFIFFRSLIPESRMAFFFFLKFDFLGKEHFSIFILCWNYLGNFSDIQQKVTSCSPARMIKIKIKKTTTNGKRENSILQTFHHHMLFLDILLTKQRICSKDMSTKQNVLLINKKGTSSI